MAKKDEKAERKRSDSRINKLSSFIQDSLDKL